MTENEPKLLKTASFSHVYYITTDFLNVIIHLERGTRVVIYHCIFFKENHHVIFLMAKKLISQDFLFFTQLNKLHFHKQNSTMSDYSPHKPELL